MDNHGEDLELFRDPAHDAAVPMPKHGEGPAECRLLVVSGAKGGVGKTVLCANIAVYLASIGRRVVVVDADGGGANLHSCLGLARPGDTVAMPEWTENGPPPGVDLVDTPVPGLRLMHAGFDEPPPSQRRRRTRRQIAACLRDLDADYAVVDLGAGTDGSMLDFWLDADISLFVTVPEPTGVENTYRFMRHAFTRFLRRRAPDRETRRAITARLRPLGTAPAPLDVIRRLDAAGDPLADLVRSAAREFEFRCVLNQTRTRGDFDLGDAMGSAVRRRLGLNMEYLGYVDHDDRVWATVRMRRPLLVESPGAKASKSIEKIARRLLALDTHRGRPHFVRDVPPGSHHDLLEVDRGATDEEVRRAFKRARDIYALESLCCYGLFDLRAMEVLRARLDEAYDVLLDPARRRPYELSVFPDAPGPESTEPSDHLDMEPKPPAPPITPETEFTGELLRAVRESQGVELREISQRTKIGTGYLRAIEDDDYGALPAPVYVRGFVAEMAKFLHLDPNQVSRTYIRRYRRYVDERGG